MINLADKLNAIDSNLITVAPDKGSALLRAGSEQVSGKGGYTYTQVTGLKGQAVPAGGKKVASGVAAVKKAIPEKFVTTTVYTDETVLFANAVYNQVVNASPRANGVAYDRVVLGIDAKPTDFVAFDTFAGVATETPETVAEQNQVISGVPTTGYVGTRQYLGYLRSRVNGLGMPAHVITGGFGTAQDAEVDGVPFLILDKSVSTDAFAIAGDWTSFYTARLFLNDIIKVKDAGTISDINNVEHNLTSENKTAAMVENWLGSGIGNLGDFVRLDAPDAA